MSSVTNKMFVIFSHATKKRSPHMGGTQLALDLSNRPRNGIFDPEKKLKSITFKCSEELLEMVDKAAGLLHTSRSEYCEFCMSEAVGNDIAKILLMKAKANTPLRDLL
jgi:hypothetical protein